MPTAVRQETDERGKQCAQNVHHNLLLHQRRTIKFIKSNPNLIVVQNEKGLGPGEIEPPEYFLFSIKDHLGNAQTYKRLIPAAAE